MNSPGELSLRILGGLVRYVEDFDGTDALNELLEGSGVERDDFEHGRWATLEQIETILARVRPRFPDDASFTRAFGYRLADSLGPMRLLAWATSPAQLFAKGFESIDTLSTISHAELVSVGRNYVDVRYWTDSPESRLLCLSRQGQIGACTTLVGLPPATFEESGCVARGDPECRYRIRWAEPRHGWLVPVGFAVGCVVAALAAHSTHAFLPWLAWPALGALLGQVVARRRVHRRHEEFERQATHALGELARVEAEARRELVGLHERQQQWNRHLEAELTERTRAAQRLAAALQEERETQQLVIRGVSHDLRNPLAALEVMSWGMKDVLDLRNEDQRALLDGYTSAVAQLKRLVNELVQDARTRLAPVASRQEVASLSARLRRRLGALVYGKDIAVSVTLAPSAPDAIEIAPLVLDRVLDNLFTNAAKYTDHGRIVLEIGGDARWLVLRLSDTGRGIEPQRLGEIFNSPGDAPRDADGKSFGVGLSVVVQLLAQIGGRLEVASRVGEGTTFWVHLPLKASPVEGRLIPISEALVADIVYVRLPSSHTLARRESVRPRPNVDT